MIGSITVSEEGKEYLGLGGKLQIKQLEIKGGYSFGPWKILESIYLYFPPSSQTSWDDGGK